MIVAASNSDGGSITHATEPKARSVACKKVCKFTLRLWKSHTIMTKYLRIARLEVIQKRLYKTHNIPSRSSVYNLIGECDSVCALRDH